MSRAGGWLSILYMVVYMLLRVGGRFKEGTYIYLWLIHVDVWQNRHIIIKQLAFR